MVTAGVLALVLVAGCVDRLVGSGPANTPSAVFDVVWQDFDLNYSFFDIKHIDWDAVYRKYKPQADTATSLNTLAPVIAAMFAELHDGHVDLTTAPGHVLRSVDFSAIHTYFDLTNLIRVYVPMPQAMASQNMLFGRVAPDIGWVWIATFQGDTWSNEIDSVLHAMNGIHTLIIDVRDNGGGDAQTAEAIASRFLDHTQVFSYIRWRNGPGHEDFSDYIPRSIGPSASPFSGKVIVLTNRNCASATEDFVLAMRSSPGVTFVGDTTLGAMGNPMTRELPNGWTYRLPHWIEYGAARELYEGIGIAPDIVVPMTVADSLSGQDLQLERAMSLAGSSTSTSSRTTARHPHH
jgi:carboxyl-terminal processing protease